MIFDTPLLVRGSADVVLFSVSTVYIMDHKCNIMIRSFQGWSFKREIVDLSTKIKPEKVVDCHGKDVFILYD